MSGQVEKEFDRIGFVFISMAISSVLISGSIYTIAYYNNNSVRFAGFIVLAAGIIFYMFVNWSGLDTIKGFLIWKDIIKENKVMKAQRLRRNLNYNLSLALFLTVFTTLIVADLVGSAKSSLTGFNTSAFEDIATAVIIADSIFVALMGNHTEFYKRRSMVMYQILVIGILFALISLLSIGLGVPHIFIVFLITLTIFAAYFLFSIFIYYEKLMLKKYGPGEI